jgi:hypothetical protein
MVEVASEKSSTVILPFPVELLRFLEHSSLPHAERAAKAKAKAKAAAARERHAKAELSSQDGVAVAGELIAAATDALAAIAPGTEASDDDDEVADEWVDVAGSAQASGVAGSAGTSGVAEAAGVADLPGAPKVGEVPDVPDIPDVDAVTEADLEAEFGTSGFGEEHSAEGRSVGERSVEGHSAVNGSGGAGGD